MKRQLLRNWLSVCVEPRRVLNIARLARYFADWNHYKRLAGREAFSWKDSYPCLSDWTQNTPFDAHYFYQSTWLAQKLSQTIPILHIDIGSSVQTIGIISAFVSTLFIDYRPLSASVEKLTTLGADILRLPLAQNSVLSLSCLHVIEHIGLGRYGEHLDPNGSWRAAHELSRVIAPGGHLFLSTPIGLERLQFNAHRIFAPRTILAMFSELRLVDFAMVGDDRMFYNQATLQDATDCTYACGMFEFVK